MFLPKEKCFARFLENCLQAWKVSKSVLPEESRIMARSTFLLHFGSAGFKTAKENYPGNEFAISSTILLIIRNFHYISLKLVRLLLLRLTISYSSWVMCRVKQRLCIFIIMKIMINWWTCGPQENNYNKWFKLNT